MIRPCFALKSKWNWKVNKKSFLVNFSDNANVYFLLFCICVPDSLSKSISFMLKVPNDKRQQAMDDHDIVAIEKGMYDQIIPEFEQLYADVGVQVKFGAKVYHLPTERSHLLLENLGMRGFKNINPLEGLDIQHTKSALKKLAQWHAASAVCVATKGSFEQKYTEGYFRAESKEKLKTMFDELNQVFLSFAKTYNNYKEYANDIVSIKLEASCNFNMFSCIFNIEMSHFSTKFKAFHILFEFI